MGAPRPPPAPRTHRSGRCHREAGRVRPGSPRGSWCGCRGPTARPQCGRGSRGCRGGRAPPPCPRRPRRRPAGPTSSLHPAPRACPPARPPGGLGPWWAALLWDLQAEGTLRPQWGCQRKRDRHPRRGRGAGRSVVDMRAGDQRRPVAHGGEGAARESSLRVGVARPGVGGHPFEGSLQLPGDSPCGDSGGGVPRRGCGSLGPGDRPGRGGPRSTCSLGSPVLGVCKQVDLAPGSSGRSDSKADGGNRRCSD